MIDCRHVLEEAGRISVVACSTCGLVQFWDESGPMDAAAGIADLFGAFTMQASFPTIHAPGREALVYRAPSKAARRHLDAFPRGTWLETQPGLWMSHDGTHLLLSSGDPLVSTNLGRGA